MKTIDFKKNIKKSIFQFFILMGSIALLFLLISKLPIRINLTPSVKKGIYILKSPNNLKNGDYIAVCLSKDLSKRIYDMGYIRKGSDCHGQYEALLKKIIATPKDKIQIINHYVFINGKNTKLKIKTLDRKNHPIPSTNFRNKFTLNGFWVIGDNHPDSYDSRYFGQVSTNQILYKASPWILF